MPCASSERRLAQLIEQLCAAVVNETIDCGGQHFHVPNDLFAALHRMRHGNLWIFHVLALCSEKLVGDLVQRPSLHELVSYGVHRRER